MQSRNLKAPKAKNLFVIGISGQETVKKKRKLVQKIVRVFNSRNYSLVLSACRKLLIVKVKFEQMVRLVGKVFFCFQINQAN